MACHGGPDIVEDNLVLCLDASHPNSNSTKMKDAIGSNDATNNGSTFVAATSSSPAYYSFDGSNDYLNVSSPNSIVNFGTNPYTVELWFNTNYDDSSQTILDPRNSGSSTSSNWYVGWYNKQGDPENSVSRKMVFGTIDSSANFYNYSYRFPSNEYNGWLQTVFTREGTGSSQQKMYWDGVLVQSDTDPSDYNVSSDDLVIGNSDRSASYYKGYVSIVRIYNGKALTAAEVKQNYNAHKGRFEL